MAFPSVTSATGYQNSSFGTTWTPFSGLIVSVGDLLVFVLAGSPATYTAAGWSTLDAVVQSTHQSVVFYKIAASTSEALTISASTFVKCSGILHRISGADSISGSSSKNFGSSNDPPLHDAGLPRDHLWIACRSAGGTTTVTGSPTGYSGLVEIAYSGSSGHSVASVRKTATAQTDDPTAFTSSTTTNWTAWTLAVWDSTGGTPDTENNLTASGFTTTAPTLGSATVGQNHVLTATSIASPPVIGAGTIGGGTNELVAANLTTTAPTLDTAALGQGHALAATSIGSAPQIGTSGLGQQHALATPGFAAATPTLGTGSLTDVETYAVLSWAELSGTAIVSGTVDDLEAEGIAAAPTVGMAGLEQAHVLIGDSFANGAPTIGTARLAQRHALGIEGMATVPTLGAATIGQAHALSGDAITSAPALNVPAIGQTHSLVSDEIVVEPTVATATVAQVHGLAATGIEATPTLGIASMSGEAVLSAQSLVATFTLGAASLGQHHTLAGASITATASLGAATPGQMHALGSEGIDVEPMVGSGAPAQAHWLTATSLSTTPILSAPQLIENRAWLAAFSLTAGTPALVSPNLGQVHTLTGVEIIAGAPAFDEPALEAAAGTFALAPANLAATAATLGAPTIEQVHALAGNSIEAAPSVGYAALVGIAGLTAVGIATTPVVDRTTFGQSHDLRPMALVGGVPIVGASAVGQTHALAANDIATGVAALTKALLFVDTGTPPELSRLLTAANGRSLAAPTSKRDMVATSGRSMAANSNSGRHLRAASGRSL